MKIIILIITVFLIFGCGKKDSGKNIKSASGVTENNATNISFFKTVSPTQKRKTEKTISYSADQIVSNANIFRENIKPKKTPLLEGIYYPTLTMKQAKYLLENGTSEWFNIASRISIKCRNFEAGNYFFENVYNVWNKKKNASTAGNFWAEFLVRHGKGKEAIKVLNMAINDAEINNEKSFVVIQSYQQKVNTYNMLKDFNNSLKAARIFFDYALTHEKEDGIAIWFPSSLDSYIRELYNNEMYDEGLNIYYQYKEKLNTKGGRLTDWEKTWLNPLKKRIKCKHTVSQSYGVLAK